MPLTDAGAGADVCAAHRATYGVVSMYSLPLLTLKRIWTYQQGSVVIHTRTQQADLGHLWGVGRKQQGGEGLPGPSWRSALVGCSEWSPSCACQRGSQQGHSQSSRSAAPAAQTLAAIVSACDAGLPVSPVVTSSSPVPSGSHSGSEQEHGGYPRTL